MLSSQTAVNFNANDCMGTNHDLFADLDAGKIVVLIWVMPCSNCINEALTAQTQVQNALASNPGRILYYLTDDYANTDCQTLNSWCSTNGITDAKVFSNAAIKMTDYGSNGMPKVIVVGGANHQIYYNQNAPNVNATGIKNAIDAAILSNTLTTKIQQYEKEETERIKIYQNPSAEFSNVSVNQLFESRVNISIFNELGQNVYDIYSGNLCMGVHKFEIKTQDLKNGNYFVSYSDKSGSVQKKLVVNH